MPILTKKGSNTIKKEQNSTRNIAVTAIVFVVVVTLAFWYLTNFVNKKIIASNVSTMQEIALHDAGSIQNSITLRWNNMEGVARELSGTQFETNGELYEILKTKTYNIPSAIKTSLLDSEGTNYISNGVVEKNSYLADVCEGRNERFVIRLNTDTHFRENTYEVIFLGVPVNFSVDGNKYEWLICQFPINTLEDELKIDSYDGKGYSSVIDADGNYIVNISRDHSFMSYDNFFDDLKDAEFDGFEDVDEFRTVATTTTGAQAVTYKTDGQERIMVITAFDVADWYFVTSVPISVFKAQSKAILSSFFVLLGIVAAFLGIVFYLALRQRRQRSELEISQAASKSKTEFLFNMSHDIRTPMNAILGYADIAVKHRDDQRRVDESLSKIKVAGEHLLSLINDILEMSRIESGKLEIVEDPMDLRKLIEGVVLMSSDTAINKSIDFKSEVGTLNNPYVYSDTLHINEVLINLVSNAIKYTPEGGKVRLKVNQLDEIGDNKATFRFIVEDNGIGMSEEFQKHLFETFSRENTSTVSKQEGAGLGLSIVKKILDLAGGTVSVKSKSGEGSTFIVDLPLRIMDDAAIEKYEEENRPIVFRGKGFSFDNKKVLLVEDNEMNREIATEILEEVGLLVETAEDGEFAVKAVAEKGADYFDFVLMDIQMPVMDGYTATNEIRKLPNGDKLIIIAVSANAFEEDVQKSLTAGMNAHVAKPIDVNRLLETMQGLMNR